MRYVLILSVVATFLFLVSSVNGRVKDTPHNLNTAGIAVEHQEVCRPCHTPHSAQKDTPLWNHELSSATWTLFEKADRQSLLDSGTRLCLSCHDGTVAIDSYGAASGTTFIPDAANLGTDLTTSHPIGVMYPTSGTSFNLADSSGKIIDPIETPTGQYARLKNGTIQCSSCHSAHYSKANYGQFLRVDNTGSKLCMTCHASK